MREAAFAVIRLGYEQFTPVMVRRVVTAMQSQPHKVLLTGEIVKGNRY